MVLITFVDGTFLEIMSDTVLNGYKAIEGSKTSEYYMENVFSDSIDGKFHKDGSPISTVNPKVGICGFICTVDCFSVGLNTEDNIVYLSSAVKSVENM